MPRPSRRPGITVGIAALAIVALSPAATAHDPVDKFNDDFGLLARWVFGPDDIGSGPIASSTDGAALHLSGDMRIVAGPMMGSGGGAALLSEGMDGLGRVEPTVADGTRPMPTRAMTVSAWVLLRQPARWGGFIGIIQDNGDAETGWLLGYQNDRFSFALATTGANEDDDAGDGRLTYLTASEPFVTSRWYHVAATYDGATMRLYVNGAAAAESAEQHGDILYPGHATYAIGAYKDDNEHHPLDGAMQHVRVYKRCLDATAIQNNLAAPPNLADAAAIDIPFRMVVAPYLQWSTTTGMTIMFETNEPARATVTYGTALPVTQTVSLASETGFHTVRLDDLETATSYFYRVEATTADGETVAAGPYTFKTTVHDDDAFAFIVMGDTQNNPAVTAAVSDFAWKHRPNFIVHCGDLVGTGEIKREWVYEFFGSAAPLLCRFPLYPTLGNHERDAQLYYDYFSLPDPEYYYDYRYGNTHFFVLDTNKDVSPTSDQYRWLDAALARSTARWKIVYHHQPAYTSDENDYGDTWEGPSTHGDVNIQTHLVPMYERYDVDVVFNGHIHVYERTWPIRAGAVDPKRGTVYITTGGSGGSLENFAPTRTWFNAHAFRGHHYCYVTVHGGTFSMKAYDIDGKMFDFLELQK